LKLEAIKAEDLMIKTGSIEAGVLLDRIIQESLQTKAEGEEAGWVQLDYEYLKRTLGIKERSARRILASLRDSGCIEVKRVGFAGPRVYLRPCIGGIAFLLGRRESC
jgi:hypothetical protein